MKNSYSLLAVAVATACYSQYAAADLKAQCLLGVPHFTGELVQDDQTQMPVYIEADSALINQPRDATYTGNVSVKQGNRSVIADQVRVEQEGDAHRQAFLQGKFDYRDNLINVTGQDASMNLLTNEANLGNAEYQFVGRQGRGTAGDVALAGDTRVLKNATYTACLPGDNAWSLEAKEMVQHVKEEYAELWHAKFRVLGVPVLYTPYLQYPIGDRRRTGLLLPSEIGRSSKNGFYYSQPFYWNIAPNMDATFTPTYYTRRGWQISPEFRYLTGIGQGLMAAEYMKKDRMRDWTNRDQARYLLHWRHNVSFLSDWRLNVDYTRVSDRRYFSDFDSSYGSSTDGYATQSFKLGYYQPNYNIAISGKKFQVFDNVSIGPYRVLPQIDFNYYKNDLIGNGNFRFYSQVARFENDSSLMPKAWRFHAEPSLNFPLANRYGSLNLETKLYATHYRQESGSGTNAEQVKSSVSRVIPQVKLDFKTTLTNDRQFVSGYNQIIEPRVQYVYRPYRNQADIGSSRQTNLGLGYDSALRQQDFFSLFSDRAFSGLDRIESANRITLGGTTRFFDDTTGEERFNLSAGQIYFLTQSRIDDTTTNANAKRSSSWALESNWKFHPKWNWRGSYQYDTRLNQTSIANSTLQYKPSKDKLIQLSYRFASEEYIDQNLQAGGNRYNQDIKQLGGVLGWEVTDKVSVMVSHYHDLALKKPVESQLGVTYNTCCWSATLYTARRLTSTPEGKPDGKNDFYYDNRFGINFELRFGGSYGSGVPRMLKRGMIPYTEAFNIN
ncbi:LPS assembly protein LptD [Pasteurellaceae bacterium RH1A]|nr:LPS assembly protein LptD [Pasteurellaceae bacterium RH1A]